MNASQEIKDLAPKMPTPYLRRFFAEKDVPDTCWTLPDREGVEHWMPNAVVVEAITTCSAREVRVIESTLRRVDFCNGDVNDFLRHVAVALINRKGSR